ncbi:MAG: arginine N-succinyltransferase [Rhodothalassiaceae bacterium]
MMRLRPIRRADLPVLMDLARATGYGMTSLPPDEPTLARRIDQSIASFAKADVDRPGPEYYLLVLERDGRVVGTTGVFATVGLAEPFYSYRVLHLTQVSRQPAKKIDTELLQLVNDFAGATELATLFLAPDHRGGGAGMFLSKARYLLIAAHRNRFSDRVMAEIRGWIDDSGHSPFWEAVGRHFFGMDFAEADRINAQGNQQFIADLMPKFPLYTALLPDQARAVIAMPHAQAQGAKRLLEDEGFRYAGAVDIFDAGPSMAAPMDQVRSVQAARAMPARVGSADQGGPVRMMVCSPALDRFRILLTDQMPTEQGLTLSGEEWDALELDGPEAELWCAPLIKGGGA